MRYVLAVLLLVGVGCDDIIQRDWVIERQGRQSREVQRDFDIMATQGWRVNHDDDLEKSGHYVYFYRLMRESEEARVLATTGAALEAGRSR